MIMKLGRPTYSKETQVYVCECKDEEQIFRFESSMEEGKWVPDMNAHLEKTRDAMISVLVEATTGWFSKPLTKEWLVPRLRYTIPTGDISADFEGTCRWVLAKSVYIEGNLCVRVCSCREAINERYRLIDLQEDTSAPRTKVEKKAVVLRARRRAAMALLKAERLMQAYAEEFGEDTDWEDEEEED
jgi:hypothetical protein